jgi:hypothetical protein
MMPPRPANGTDAHRPAAVEVQKYLKSTHNKIKNPRPHWKRPGATFSPREECRSAGFANLRNPVIGPASRRSSLFRVLRWGLAAWLFYRTKPWRQVIQRRLSVADRCRKYNTIYHSRVRGRRPVYLNGRTHQDRRQQRNHCHWRSQMHGLTRDFAPTGIVRWRAHKMPLTN